MRIVAAELSLIKDLLDEIEVIASDQQTLYKVYAGRHPTLGKIVIVESKEGDGVIVELD
jgi:chaperonin cofactor prefoldin